MPLIKLKQLDIASFPELARTMTNRQIAEKFGVQVEWVKKRIDRLRDSGIDIPLRPRGKARKRVIIKKCQPKQKNK